ncbi:MAG: hypothetical protein OEN01_06935 [Candidatus Krumholzibacteria bacterium]|nr:hypothetical protein [Candidatus Krumholzibacteria bacterium]
MSQNYYEVVVKGDDNLLKGFLSGFKAAKRIKSGLIFAADHPIDTHHLKEILTFQRDHVHLAASERYHAALLAAIKAAAEIDIEIVSDKRISKAYFDFKFSTFNRDVASKLKRRLARLPVGLELADFEPKETIEPSGKGVELYSPLHDYAFEGKGRVQGDLEKLLLFHRKCEEHVFIETSDIELES